MKKVLVSLSILIVACAHTQKGTNKEYILENPSKVGETQDGTSVYQGGFSGLWFVRQGPEDGEYEFLSVSDRGPNAEPMSLDGYDRKARPFLIPTYVPRIYKIKTNSRDMTLKVVEEILLRDPAGNVLSGLPQWIDSENQIADEIPVDQKGKKLGIDPLGVDTEGICVDDDGNFWIVEEYRPSIMKFDAGGNLVKRYIPRNSLPSGTIKEINLKYGREIISPVLPEVLKLRKRNRGFESVTSYHGKIIAVLQSPIPWNKTAPVIEFDPKSEKVVNQFEYNFVNPDADKVGDISLAPEPGHYFAIEQNGKIGKESYHIITSFTLSARDVKPTKVIDLVSHGYDFEKVEGIALLPNGKIAVINDNDFGVNKKDVPTVLSIFDLN